MQAGFYPLQTWPSGVTPYQFTVSLGCCTHLLSRLSQSCSNWALSFEKHPALRGTKLSRPWKRKAPKLGDQKITKNGTKRKTRKSVLWSTMIFNVNEKRGIQWQNEIMQRTENLFLGLQRGLQPITCSKEMQLEQDVLLSLVQLWNLPIKCCFFSGNLS